LALDRGQSGILEAPSAYFCKHPLRQFTDDQAFQMMEDFIKGEPSTGPNIEPSTVPNKQ